MQNNEKRLLENQNLDTYTTIDLVELEKILNQFKYRVEQVLESRQNRFTVSIFGSARVIESDPLYAEIEELAYNIGMLGANVVTGGGPGIMQAANQGVKRARPGERNSFGVTIKLPHEQSTNKYVDEANTHSQFTSRLDEFIRLSHMFIVAPGGIGTLLELSYIWQLNQVQMNDKKIVLYKSQEHWQGLLSWAKESLLSHHFADPADLQILKMTDSTEDILEIVRDEMADFYDCVS